MIQALYIYSTLHSIITTRGTILDGVQTSVIESMTTYMGMGRRWLAL